MSARGPQIRVGLPYSSKGPLARTANELGAATLISAGSLWSKRRAKFRKIGLAAWTTGAALDSAGFVAMRQGGYRWSISEYVEMVVTNAGDGSMPFPWSWWSAPDYCCEPEIAADRAEVERRIALTVSSYRETLAELDWWRGEGDTEVPDPMPILQGRTAADYVACALELARVCRDGKLPKLVGVGSVCRRALHGPEGLLTVLEALDRALPKGVRLHLFGVKGQLLRHLAPLAHRVASVDSMAWDSRARHDARDRGIPNTTAHRAAHLRSWYERNVEHRDEALAQPVQLSLFAA